MKMHSNRLNEDFTTEQLKILSDKYDFCITTKTNFLKITVFYPLPKDLTLY